MIVPLPVFHVQTNTVLAITKPVEAKPKPVEYRIARGDSLESIAVAHHTTAQRLFDKNTSITNPNVINEGDSLVVPLDTEALVDRPMPVTIEVLPKQLSPPSGGSSNTYYYRQCVWYAKEKRPDIPNTWGNATDWLMNAQAQGWPTGLVAKAGSIGWTYGHVVYIESVNDDGTVYLSEMNYDYNGGFRYRTAPATDFTYIY